jgi:hypothetical protein
MAIRFVEWVKKVEADDLSAVNAGAVKSLEARSQLLLWLGEASNIDIRHPAKHRFVLIA